MIGRATRRQADHALANDGVAGTHRKNWQRRSLGRTGKPRENLGQSVPERIDRKERRKLMVQHMHPAGFERSAVRFQLGKIRQAPSLEGAFLAEDIEELLAFGACLGVAIEIHDVVEVAWTRSFGQSSEFFGEGLDVIVGQHFNAFFRHVGVGMEYLSR